MFVSVLVQLLAKDLTSTINSLLPTQAEEIWLSVPWRTNLMAARLESQDSKKPMFLWVMNGHPLGCT
jgi:hypothetical protein